jgi:hypothetical protein
MQAVFTESATHSRVNGLSTLKIVESLKNLVLQIQSQIQKRWALEREQEMSTPEIRAKLTAELHKGITTEVQVVYLLAGIRKLIERDELGEEYSDLKFYCDWTLHSHLDRAGAKAILSKFDAAHPLLRSGTELHNLPSGLRTEITRISKMNSFEKQLTAFLDRYKLPPLTLHREDGWAHFLHLYTRVIHDIPLMVSVRKERRRNKAKTSPPEHISRIIVHFEAARETMKSAGREDVLFKVTWRAYDKNGESGAISIFNSYELNPADRDNSG